MTSKIENDALDREKMQANLEKMDALTKRLTAALTQKRDVNPALEAPGQDLFVKATAAFANDVVANPAKLIGRQMGYWSASMKNLLDEQDAAAPQQDRRFKNPLWSSHPFFKYVKNQYLLNAEMLRTIVADAPGLDERDQGRLDYFTGQLIDALSPTNFLSTNPDALEAAVATNGDSLVQGLENLVQDLEANNGDLMVTLSDPSAFTLGENLATTPGEVVFRNRMFELIQYTPTTDTVSDTPVVFFPPWINKYYILDLTPENSLIAWLVGQGHTVFVVSWLNPDDSYANVGMGDYIRDGYLAAIDQVKTICDVSQVNAVGYCIAGTTLAATLALLAQKGDTSVRSASFFTTLTDFADQGEFVGFLSDDFVDGIEEQCLKDGVLDRYYTARTFSYLRANDLIYGPAIRAYMMGKAPPKFDLLHWNGDGTNLPGKMAIEYLRGLCQGNQLGGQGFPVGDAVARLDQITQPVCAIACETDHIAPWIPSFEGIQKMTQADRTFILAQSGHVAGIINPPHKKKYGHYVDMDVTLSPDAAKKGATFRPETWWGTWESWLRTHSGGELPARSPKDSLCPAPGTYVLPKAALSK